MPADTVHKHENTGSARGFLYRLEFPADALLVIYFAVFARQYLWFLTGHNRIAWVISIFFGLSLTALYNWTKPREVSEGSRKLNLPFWLIVGLPLVFVYAMRVVFPDLSFDVLNYRIFHAERAMRGFLFLPSDFFPTPAPYNPAPDMITGLFRQALGYRLGTIANLLAMIWVARIVEKLLRPFIRNSWLRAAGILIAVSAEHLLFEINNYMADLLALPLILEATYLAVFSDIGGTRKTRLEARNLVCIALLLGMSVALKLTNAGIALPIVLLCAYRALQPRFGDIGAGSLKQLSLTTLLAAVAFIAPLLPFTLYLYRDTGSPVFPVFNGIFKSVFWPPHSIWDPRWGPVGWWEKILWPILVSIEPDRLSELAVYSGRISLGFIIADCWILSGKKRYSTARALLRARRSRNALVGEHWLHSLRAVCRSDGDGRGAGDCGKANSVSHARPAQKDRSWFAVCGLGIPDVTGLLFRLKPGVVTASYNVYDARAFHQRSPTPVPRSFLATVSSN